MERKSSRHASELTGIYLDLEQGIIEFEDRHGTVGRLRIRKNATQYEGQPLLFQSDRSAEPPARGPSRRRRRLRRSPPPEPGTKPPDTGW